MSVENVKFYTERTSVKNWSSVLADSASRRKLVEDCKSILTPNVLRYLPESLSVTASSEDINRWIDARKAEGVVLTISDSISYNLLGFIILAESPHDDSPQTVHLGYFFGEPYWGKGYATEVLKGLIGHLARRNNAIRVLGGVEKGNHASASVLFKAGFVIDTKLSDDSTDMFVYEV